MYQKKDTVFTALYTTTRLHHIRIRGEHSQSKLQALTDAIETSASPSDAADYLADEGAEVIGFDAKGTYIDTTAEVTMICKTDPLKHSNILQGHF